MGSVSAQHRKEFGCNIFAIIPVYKVNNVWGIEVLATRHPLISWMIDHVSLEISGLETSSQLAGPGPQWTAADRIIYRKKIRYLAKILRSQESTW